MKFFRTLKKNIPLRLVNFVGLTTMFACLLLSASYIKREVSYDKHHTNADNIVRLSLQFDNQPIDVRIFGKALDNILHQIPEIERIVEMLKIQTAVISYRGEKQVINNLYAVNNEFLNVFDLHLLKGDRGTALQRMGQVLFSERFANELLGNIDNLDLQTSGIKITGRQYNDSVFVSGIFKDINF